MNDNLSTKLRASGIHLLCSAILAFLVIILIFVFWYQPPLAKATGVSKIFLIVLTVDVILGPLLTFIIYKKEKKSLVFDMAVIILLQIAAFVYGLNVIYQGKPAWIVFNADRVDLVTINEIDKRHINKAEPEFQKPSLLKPKWAAAFTPKSYEKSNDILFEAVFTGVDIYHRPELYQPLNTAYPNIIKKSKDLTKLHQYNPPIKVDTVLAKYPEADSFLPLKANAQDMTVLISKKNGGKVVKIVDLRPWN